MIGIYAIINPNNEVYIGKSTNIERRMGYYRSIPKGMPPKLKASFVKYGFENHTKEILKECSVEDMPKWERYYQIEYDSIDNGLNVNIARETDQNGFHSKERIEKRANSNRGKKRSEETKDLMSKRQIELGDKTTINKAKVVIAENKINGEIIIKSSNKVAKYFKVEYKSFRNRIGKKEMKHSIRKDLDEWYFYFKNPEDRI